MEDLEKDAEIVDNGAGKNDNNDESQNQGDDSIDYDAEVAKRGAKNIIEENKRRAREMKSLRDEFETFKASVSKPEPKKEEVKKIDPEIIGSLPPHMAKALKKWTEENPENRRVDKEFINDIFRVILDTSVGAIDYHLNNDEGLINKKFSALSKVEKKYANDTLKESVNNIVSKPAYKILATKYRDEIEAEIKKELMPEYWDNESLIEKIAGGVFAKHFTEFTGNGELEDKPVIKKVSETDNNTSGRTVSGVSSDELKEYAEQFGIDISNPSARKAAIDGILAKKRTQARLDK